MDFLRLCLIWGFGQWESSAADKRMREKREWVIHSLTPALCICFSGPKGSEESGSLLLNYSSLWVLVAGPSLCLFRPEW